MLTRSTFDTLEFSRDDTNEREDTGELENTGGLEDTSGLDDGSGIETRAEAASAGWSPPIDGHGLFKSLMVRLPRRVRRSFDHEQRLALRQAAEEMAWGEHPIDIRLSLPLPGPRRYLVLVGGRERRRAGDRFRQPLVRTGNIASILVFLCLLLGFGTFLWLAAGVLLPG